MRFVYSSFTHRESFGVAATLWRVRGVSYSRDELSTAKGIYGSTTIITQSSFLTAGSSFLNFANAYADTKLAANQPYLSSAMHSLQGEEYPHHKEDPSGSLVVRWRL